MRYFSILLSTTLLILLLPAAVAGHSANPAVEQWDNAMNQPTYWENRFPGFDCTKYDGLERLVGIPENKYKTIFKGAQYVNIYHSLAYAPHVHTPDGDRGVSWTTVCSKDGFTQQGTPDAKMRSFGPKGDPWYRFAMYNTGDYNATCKAVFEGRDGQRVVRRKLAPEQGYKTGWMWVKGSTPVKMVCYSNGERVFKRTFRSAPPGYYGPLWFGYSKGYFTLR